MIGRVAWLAMLIAMASPPRALPAEVAIEVGHALAEPGGRARLEVRLRTDGAEVAGTQNRLEFDPLTPLAVLPGAVARPDCFGANLPGLDGVAFSLQPPGCRPGIDCGVRALRLVLSSEAIPDGALLYACEVEVSPGAALGSYPVRCTESGGSDGNGNALSVACVDGAVVVVAALPTPTATGTATRTPTERPATRTPVPTITRTPTVTGTPCDPPCAAVRVGSAVGRPGKRVRFGARLDALGHEINGVVADVGFDRRVRIAAGSDSRPDCQFSRGLGGFTGFSFQPPQCGGARRCEAVRALVLPVREIAIPDQTELFSCAVEIAPDAPPGLYALPIANVGGSTAAGMAVPMTGSAGAVLVEPEPSATSTATPTPTPTGVSDSGCRIGASGASPAWSVLIGTLIAISLRRRRR